MGTAIQTRTMLGMVGDKTYYWNFQTDSLEWSVPDPRSAICAEDGYVILAADYAQIEVKLMAHASGDPILIAAINSGHDVHSFNATKVFGVRYKFTYEEMEEARDSESHPRHNELSLIRSRIKTVTFGVPYGAGPTRVALMTGMSIDEAKAFIEEFFGTFKVLKQWLERQGLLAVELGYSCSPRGRKRFYTLPVRRCRRRQGADRTDQEVGRQHADSGRQCRHPQGRNAKHLPGDPRRFLRRQEAVRCPVPAGCP